MKKLVYLVLLIVSVPFLMAAGRIISYAIIDWEKISAVKSHTGWTRSLFKNPTSGLDVLEIQAFTLYPGKATHTYLIDRQNYELYLVKEGSAEISVNGERRKLDGGGVAVVSQENRVAIRNIGTMNLVYYSVRLKPRFVKPASKSERKGKIFFAAGDTIKPETIPEGERRNIFDRQATFLQNLDIHSITLKPDFNGHEVQAPGDEKIIIISKGSVFGSINEVPYKIGTGSLLFISNGVPLKISNADVSSCHYYVISWNAWKEESKK